jgi:hypothetical protein
VLLPVEIYATRNGGSFTANEPFSPLGYLPGVYLISIQSIVPGGEITIGSDTYRCFPLHQKEASGADNGTTLSGWRGFCLKSN